MALALASESEHPIDEFVGTMIVMKWHDLALLIGKDILPLEPSSSSQVARYGAGEARVLQRCIQYYGPRTDHNGASENRIAMKSTQSKRNSESNFILHLSTRRRGLITYLLH